MYFINAIKAYCPNNAEEEIEKESICQFIEEKGERVLLRESTLAHITSTAMIFNGEKDKLLMVHHNIYDTWACVGGHADGMDDLLLYFQPDELNLSKGTKVRITGGEFEGQEGIFLKVKGARDRRVVIEIQGVIAVAMATIHPDLIEVIG